MVTYKSLKTKEKLSWVIPKVVLVAYGSIPSQELSIIKLKAKFKLGFTKVVVTGAGPLQEWSLGELKLSRYLAGQKKGWLFTGREEDPSIQKILESVTSTFCWVYIQEF